MGLVLDLKWVVFFWSHMDTSSVCVFWEAPWGWSPGPARLGGERHRRSHRVRPRWTRSVPLTCAPSTGHVPGTGESVASRMGDVGSMRG